ncbi:MAG: hypothetical protein ACPGFA_04260, partial [Pikeienuella sp.]
LNPVTATETVEVVEPVLVLDKSTTVVGPVDGGDIIPFTITIVNSGTGPAFDVAIVDQLADAGLSLVSGSAVTSDGTPVVEVANGDGTLGFTLEAPVIDAGETYTITYNAIVSEGFQFLTDLENTAQVTQFDTNPLDPGDVGFVDQRVFEIDPNDPNDPLTDTVDLEAAGPDFEKTVFTTSVQQTGDDALDPNAPDLAIGEVVVYRFTSLLPEGIADLTITDQFPLGGAFEVLDVIVTPTGSLSGPQFAAPVVTFVDSNADGFNDRLTIDLGEVTNTPDNVSNADDVLTVDVLVRIEDDPRNASGDSYTNVATFDFGTGTLQDDATVDIVEPRISIDKTVSDDEPFLGDVITYTLVVENDGAATGPAIDLVVTDVLPDGLKSDGNITFSDPALATVTQGGTAGETTIIIDIPLLQPGETLEITYDVLVDFISPVLSTITNTAQITGGTVPETADPPANFPGDPAVADGPGRVITGRDTADIIASAVPSNRTTPTPNLSQIDDEQFLPLISIDPIFSGSAEYGSNITLTLQDRAGGFIASRYVMSDAAGQWIATFPMFEMDTADRDVDSFFRETSIFRDNTGLLPQTTETDLFGLGVGDRDVRIGAFLEDDIYRLSISEDPSSNVSQSGVAFNTRVYYVPSSNHEVFITPNTLNIAEIFENIAEVSVERMFESAVNPLASGLNRFNNEFLAASGTSSGR